MSNDKDMKIINAMLRTVDNGELKISPVNIEGNDMYGIYFICNCSECKNSKTYLAIAPSPAVAVRMLIHTTSNVEFLAKLGDRLDKLIAESN